VYNLGKLWEKTGDVEKLRSRAGRGESLDDYMEQALVEIFPQNVNIIMDEARGGFERGVSRMTLSRLLRRNNVTCK
jgi:hypothetical protein